MFRNSKKERLLEEEIVRFFALILFIYVPNELSRLSDNLLSLNGKRKNRNSTWRGITSYLFNNNNNNNKLYNLPYLIVGQICVKLIYDSTEFSKFLFSFYF